MKKWKVEKIDKTGKKIGRELSFSEYETFKRRMIAGTPGAGSWADVLRIRAGGKR